MGGKGGQVRQLLAICPFAIALVVNGMAAAANITSSTEVRQSPTPRASRGTEYHNYCITKDESLVASGKRWRSCGYVVDMPSFPLPLFVDGEQRDVTTAHLTFCGVGRHNNRTSENRFKATFYYDKTPDGTWNDLTTLTAEGDADVQTLGGDTSPWYSVPASHVNTVVDRSVVVTAPDGTSMAAPDEKGTKWYVTWKKVGNGLAEVWVFEYTQ